MSTEQSLNYRKSHVCQILGCSKSKLERMIREGIFPKPSKLGSRFVFWPKKIVDEWYENLTQSAK